MSKQTEKNKTPWFRYPCYGTLPQIHETLLDPLEWENKTVTINGWAYTVEKYGFRSNTSNKIIPMETLAIIHPGEAIFVGYDNPLDDENLIIEIVTMDKLPHISQRCQLCGDQLNREEIRRGACDSCYAQAVGG